MEAKIIEITDNVNIAPYKYNGGQLYNAKHKERKYCVNADWFSLTAIGFPVPSYAEQAPELLEFDGGNIRLEVANKGYGTKHYKFIYNVFVKGDENPFATLLTVPRNIFILKGGSNELKVLNHALYERNWTRKLSYVMSCLELQYNNITHLDIALDGEGFFDFFNDYQSGLYDKLGKASYNPHYTGNRELTGYDFGSKKSDKKLTCYNKTKRLEVENKPYINEFWKRNGLKVKGDVERLELKLKSKAAKEFADPETGEKGIDITRLEDPAYLAGIMKATFKNWFEFVLPGDDKNISRRERISPVDWSELQYTDMEKLKNARPANDAWQAKRAISKLLKDSRERKYLAGAVRKCLEKHFLYKVPEEALEMIPEAIAWAMAEDNGVTNWLLKKEQFKAKGTEQRIAV